MSSRHYTRADRAIMQMHAAIRTLLPFKEHPNRASPANAQIEERPLTPEESRHVAGLMRINHTGEVCAQALYQGQALTARKPELRAMLENAADEEIDHLAWCEQRIRELQSHRSVLNPVFYTLSFGMGALTGLISDHVSLGFVAATEEQVGKHLNAHLKEIPNEDRKTRAILEQMKEDEAKHEKAAIRSGGWRFIGPVKAGMTLLSKIMTHSTYRI